MAFQRKQLAESAKRLTRTIEVPMGETAEGDPLTLTLTILPLALDEKELRAKGKEIEESGDEDAARSFLIGILADSIDSWDMQDEDADGNIYDPEPTREYLDSFSTIELNAILLGIQEAQGGFTEGTSGSSTASRTSGKKSRKN